MGEGEDEGDDNQNQQCKARFVLQHLGFVRRSVGKRREGTDCREDVRLA